MGLTSIAIMGLRGRECAPGAGNTEGPVMGTVDINGAGAKGCLFVTFYVFFSSYLSFYGGTYLHLYFLRFWLRGFDLPPMFSLTNYVVFSLFRDLFVYQFYRGSFLFIYYYMFFDPSVGRYYLCAVPYAYTLYVIRGDAAGVILPILE